MQNGLLISAASKGNAEGCRALLDRGADVNAESGVWESPLHAAVTMGHANAARVLIERGADVARRFKGTGRTMLIVAAFNGDLELCRLLLAQGCDVNHADEKGWTAIHGAAFEGRSHVVKLLSAHGARLDHPSSECASPLHAAIAGTKDIETCKVLVELGLAPDMVPDGVPDDYVTPLQFAIGRDAEKVVRFFVEVQGACPDMPTLDGRTVNDLCAISPRVRAYLNALQTGSAVASALEQDTHEHRRPSSARSGMAPL